MSVTVGPSKGQRYKPGGARPRRAPARQVARDSRTRTASRLRDNQARCVRARVITTSVPPIKRASCRSCIPLLSIFGRQGYRGRGPIKSGGATAKQDPRRAGGGGAIERPSTHADTTYLVEGDSLKGVPPPRSRRVIYIRTPSSQQQAIHPTYLASAVRGVRIRLIACAMTDDVL
jgi:hypothetical protein